MAPPADPGQGAQGGQGADNRQAPPGPARLLLALRGSALLAGLIAAGWVLSHAGLRGDALPNTPGLYILAAGGLCAIGLPRQAACFAAGFAFGSERGLPLALAAQMLGCTATFLWARLVGRAAARAWLNRRQARGGVAAWAARADLWLAQTPFATTLTLRLVPVGNNVLLNILAGISAAPPAPFLAASLLGYLPQTLVFVLAGSGVHVNRSLELALGGALFALSATIGVLAMRRLPPG